MLCLHASASFVLTHLAMQNPVTMMKNAAIIAIVLASSKIFTVAFVSNIKRVSVVHVTTTNYVTYRRNALHKYSKTNQNFNVNKLITQNLKHKLNYANT